MRSLTDRGLVLLDEAADAEAIGYLEHFLAGLSWLRLQRMAERAPPTPRLELWRKREHGKPMSAWRYDDLWRAACWEAASVQAWYAGFVEAAYDCAAKAATIVRRR